MADPASPAIVEGFGHRGAMRVGNLQAVRPRWSETWDIFDGGRCIETGLTESEARERLTSN